MKVRDVAFFIGRFQPVHNGHVYALKYILERHKQIIIGIGSALESHTLRNPFTAGERLEMLRLTMDFLGIDCRDYYIIAIPDTDVHITWVSIVEMLTPKFNVVYSNDPLTRRLFKEAGYEVRAIPLYERNIYSGEEFRRRVISGGNWKELVPHFIAEYLTENGLIERLRELARTDKPYKHVDY